MKDKTDQPSFAFILFGLACLSFAFVSGTAFAQERWVFLGDLHVLSTHTTGKLSINLDSLRNRGKHHEIWERVVFEVDAAEKPPTLRGEDVPERLTLWAIRCKRGDMAKVTEKVGGSFEPRANPLRFHVPAPTSSAAAIIETTCAEVGLQHPNNAESVQRLESPDTSDGRPLAYPPSILIGDEDTEGNPE